MDDGRLVTVSFFMQRNQKQGFEAEGKREAETVQAQKANIF
jgi:hypothetical protein